MAVRGTMSKDEVLAMVERRGGRVVNGKKHLKVWAPDGRFVCVLPHGPKLNNDRRAYLNLIRTLRSKGLAYDDA